MADSTPSPALPVEAIEEAIRTEDVRVATIYECLSAWFSQAGVPRWKIVQAQDDLTEIAAQLTALLAAAEEGRKDTERLDWLNGQVDHQAADAYLHVEFDTNSNLRAFIDAARTPDPAREDDNAD